MRRMPTDAEWVNSRIENLPANWGVTLVRKWDRLKDQDYRRANIELRVATQPFLAEPLGLDASDAAICDAAANLAERCFSRSQIFQTIPLLRDAMERVCLRQGITPPEATRSDHAAIARMTCPLWWRRKLRRRHGRKVEAAAIRLGRVSRKGDLYVSNEGLRARQQQNQRNTATLEATVMRNELQQEFTLAELQSKSTSNKKIKRAELMTRMSGFERCADQHGHTGMFLTVTCPSRFHRFRTVKGGKVIIDNPNHVPEATPAEGQRYLAKVWSRIRAELKRKGLDIYGFRIAEPQHDGTPHWHLLLFCQPEHADCIEAIVHKHALKDSPDEPGAREHRCDFKRIDKAKGSATGYIAKYIAKNIDGEHIDNDLEGCPGAESSQRVEAWAARWNIRQFQQIGGAPVGVWRELRRIKHIAADAPACLRDAHDAASKRAACDEHEAQGAAWDKYCEVQGGVFCGRSGRIKLLLEQPKALGRYGEQQAPRPVGVQVTVSVPDAISYGNGIGNGCGNSNENKTDPCNGYGYSQPDAMQVWEARSSRYQWVLVKATQGAEELAFENERAQPSTPWTCVNNCTDGFEKNRSSTHEANLKVSEDAETKDDSGGRVTLWHRT